METQSGKQPLIIRDSKLGDQNSNDYVVHVNSQELLAQIDTEIDSNRISTSKYTMINCIPKMILEQFSKLANLYFLIIAIMQSINEISISQGKPVILLPLSVVVIINGIKDFVEDWKRKKSDDEENFRNCLIFDNTLNAFALRKWADVRKGDIIKVNSNENFPADMVLINSSDPEGIAYIDTKNLDGETNLKCKQANSHLASKIKSESDLRNLTGSLRCKGPNEFIYEFDAQFELEGHANDTIYIDKNSFLLRGCLLKQTEYVYGFVVYIGHNTKIMKNSPNARTKNSRIEKIMNFQIIKIFILQLILSALGSVLYLSALSKHKAELQSYISPKQTDGFLFFFYRIGTWILIFTNLVPISLLVTLEMIKFIQGMFISWDITIYDRDTKTPAKVQTSTLNEELGQVKYIFSDKTGTLTKNYMEFRKMSIGKYSYGVDKPATINKTDNYGKITNFHLYDPEFEKHLRSSDDNIKHENYTNIHLFLTNLATCHTVITDSKEIQQLLYQSSSPDEMALINAARYFKYIFKGRDINNNITLEIDNKPVIYNMLNLLEYSSERKRMSVILKCPDNKIRLFIKGADSVIKERVTQNREMITIADSHLLKFAQRGLRTLMVAYKEISLKEYDEWSDDYRNAISNPLEKDKLLPNVLDKIEQGLFLLGSTAIEDQLQENIDQVLSSFIETGIKVWVLTGDKTDTAKSIAFSCKLISHEFVLFEFKDQSSTKEIRDKLSEFIKTISDNMNSNKKHALIVSLDELTRIMKNKDLTENFYQLSIRCNSVLCCRVTPKQKAQMVNLIKDRQPNITTLAIGDGANDVNMISSAHIGIGILGVEGRQAARASDYAIAQFQYLKRLLFVHGRESYRKNSFVVCYNFYKNVLFVMPQFWFGFVSYFSGQTLYDPWIYQLFNIVFSCFPIIWFGIYDKEVSAKILMVDPRYYVQGIVGKLFHSTRFWKWVMFGILQGVLVYLFSFFANRGSFNITGLEQDLFSCGSIAYSAIVIIVNVKLLYSTSTHSIISVGLFIFSVGMYYLILSFMSNQYRFENFNNSKMNFSSNIYYLSTFMMVIVCIFIDVGLNKILLTFGVIIDPLEVKADDDEDKIIEVKYAVVEDIELLPPKEINNNYYGAAFSQESGQTPQISNNLVKA